MTGPRRIAAAALPFAVAGLLVLAACHHGPALPEPGSIEADKFLFDRGTAALNDHKWLEAREYLRRLVDNYPQSQYRYDAKLGIGDSYLGEGSPASDILAANEFREFLSFFPLHPRADYAQYKIGLSHFNQMLSPERDQTETKAAITEFDTFLRNYPDSKLAPDVKALWRQARDRLSEHDFRIGKFYYNFKIWGRRRPVQGHPRGRSAVHQPGRRVLLPGGGAPAVEAAGRGPALLQQARRGIPGERVPGRREEADRSAQALTRSCAVEPASADVRPSGTEARGDVAGVAWPDPTGGSAAADGWAARLSRALNRRE